MNQSIKVQNFLNNKSWINVAPVVKNSLSDLAEWIQKNEYYLQQQDKKLTEIVNKIEKNFIEINVESKSQFNSLNNYIKNIQQVIEKNFTDNQNSNHLLAIKLENEKNIIREQQRALEEYSANYFKNLDSKLLELNNTITNCEQNCSKIIQESFTLNKIQLFFEQILDSNSNFVSKLKEVLSINELNQKHQAIKVEVYEIIQNTLTNYQNKSTSEMELLESRITINQKESVLKLQEQQKQNKDQLTELNDQLQNFIQHNSQHQQQMAQKQQQLEQQNLELQIKLANIIGSGSQNKLQHVGNDQSQKVEQISRQFIMQLQQQQKLKANRKDSNTNNSTISAISITNQIEGNNKIQLQQVQQQLQQHTSDNINQSQIKENSQKSQHLQQSQTQQTQQQQSEVQFKNDIPEASILQDQQQVIQQQIQLNVSNQVNIPHSSIPIVQLDENLQEQIQKMQFQQDELNTSIQQEYQQQNVHDINYQLNLDSRLTQLEMMFKQANYSFQMSTPFNKYQMSKPKEQINTQQNLSSEESEKSNDSEISQVSSLSLNRKEGVSDNNKQKKNQTEKRRQTVMNTQLISPFKFNKKRRQTAKPESPASKIIYLKECDNMAKKIYERSEENKLKKKCFTEAQFNNEDLQNIQENVNQTKNTIKDNQFTIHRFINQKTVQANHAIIENTLQVRPRTQTPKQNNQKQYNFVHINELCQDNDQQNYSDINIHAMTVKNQQRLILLPSHQPQQKSYKKRGNQSVLYIPDKLIK